MRGGWGRAPVSIATPQRPEASRRDAHAHGGPNQPNRRADRFIPQRAKPGRKSNPAPPPFFLERTVA